ncbi:hypothetical protein C0081_18670 [Cohaesibacter celericrescens]|uniref:Uncharacterized protein n=1 Tax=Cohaesibacter celericrescens TaxID=2067669 RepID=A0A2N5XML6_9HYPH|nr:hypothetical protein C0081_18670 [Cohaesibacter celericrescens]
MGPDGFVDYSTRMHNDLIGNTMCCQSNAFMWIAKSATIEISRSKGITGSDGSLGFQPSS